jgi:hypothetical protein
MDNSHVRSASVSASVSPPLSPHNPLAAAPAKQHSSLHRLLDQSQQFSPEYGGQLSNHLPMALHALHALGANEARLQSFFNAYATSHLANRATPAIADSPEADRAGGESLDWQACFGQLAAFNALRRHFSGILSRQGRDAVLREVLPELLPGLAAAAFHGAIRTAHAVESEHEVELASALAYWTCRWQPLPAPLTDGTPVPMLGLDAWAKRLRHEARTWRGDAPLIFLRMQQASATPSLASLAVALAPAISGRDRLAELASLALTLYLESRSFTVLHMITGLRALRVLSTWVDLDAAPVQPLLARVFVAAFMASGAQRQDLSLVIAAALRQRASWQALAAAAVQADDEHEIKLVHACREEMAVYGDERYLHAAALVLTR